MSIQQVGFFFWSPEMLYNKRKKHVLDILDVVILVYHSA